ncbi:hypothetical protein ES703_118539 [subsurface metagenome]
MELEVNENISALKIKNIFNHIAKNRCIHCSSHLHYDEQPDSLYISCSKNFDHFRISGFKDIETGKIILIYLNNMNEGIMNEKLLRDFQKIIHSIKFSLL